MFHRFFINSSGISRLSGKLTDLFSSRGSKARSKFSFRYFSKGGSKSHNLCICVYFFLCEYLLASFSVYVIVYSCVNVHLCVFVCTSACHVSLLERYKPSAFVYFCLCCGVDMFFGILKLVPTSQWEWGRICPEYVWSWKVGWCYIRMGMGGPWKFRDQAGCDPESMITERCPVTVDVLGKVRTNEMRGQPRDDMGYKQIQTSNSFWFFQAFPWQYSIAGNFCHWSGQKGDYLSQDKSFQRSRMSGCIFTKYKCWWGWWEAVVDTSMYEDEWVVVGCVGVVLERVREILLMPQDGRRRGRTPF